MEDINKANQIINQFTETENKINEIITYCHYNYINSDKDQSFKQSKEYISLILSNIAYQSLNVSNEFEAIFDKQLETVDQMIKDVEVLYGRFNTTKTGVARKEIRKMMKSSNTCTLPKSRNKRVNVVHRSGIKSLQNINLDKYDSVGISISSLTSIGKSDISQIGMVSAQQRSAPTPIYNQDAKAVSNIPNAPSLDSLSIPTTPSTPPPQSFGNSSPSPPPPPSSGGPPPPPPPGPPSSGGPPPPPPGPPSTGNKPPPPPGPPPPSSGPPPPGPPPPSSSSGGPPPPPPPPPPAPSSSSSEPSKPVGNDLASQLAARKLKKVDQNEIKDASGPVTEEAKSSSSGGGGGGDLMSQIMAKRNAMKKGGSSTPSAPSKPVSKAPPPAVGGKPKPAPKPVPKPKAGGGVKYTPKPKAPPKQVVQVTPGGPPPPPPGPPPPPPTFSDDVKPAGNDLASQLAARKLKKVDKNEINDASGPVLKETKSAPSSGGGGGGGDLMSQIMAKRRNMLK